MTQNLITSAFELVRDVEHGVLLLDTFHRLASREVWWPMPSREPSLACSSPCAFPVPSARHCLSPPAGPARPLPFHQRPWLPHG